MRLVIDIPDWYYAELQEFKHPDFVDKAIMDGIPLPKEHGRLIDADAFIATLEDASKRHKYKELLIDDCLTVDDVFKAIIESLQNKGLAEGDAPTIVEADKEA